MKFSLPFLASKKEQLPPPGQYANQCVEAVIFNKEDLSSPTWEIVWKQIEKAVLMYGPRNVTFHFPVNDCDYVEDTFVKNKLMEALKRASDLHLHGIVVHSNRIHLIKKWHLLNLKKERKKTIEVLEKVRSECKSSTFLALENMPIMDNYGIEIDPLFVYPEDFQDLKNTGIKVVWDICHYTNTLAYLQKVEQRYFSKKNYPHILPADIWDFLTIQDQIVHWHFSAFEGLADPDLKTLCKEGVLPQKSTLGNIHYQQIMEKVSAISNLDDHIVFEIQEEDYQNRKEFMEMVKWTNAIVT